MTVDTAARPVPRSSAARVTSWLRGPSPLAIAIAVAVCAAVINAVWLVHDRLGGALTIDESGYIALAVNDHIRLLHTGPVGLARFILGQPVQPPLVTALSSLVYLATGPTILGAFAVQLAAYVTTVLTTFFVGRRLAGPVPGVTCAIVVASAPISLDYVHTYSFALPAAACLTAAVLAAVQSRNLTRIGWAAVWGGALGAMVMSRSMTIAFIPAFALLAIVQVLTAARKRRALVGLAAGIAAAAAVAAPWYAVQGRSVIAYLTSYGYGAQSVAYGPKTSPLSLSSWSTFLRVNISEYLWLPLAVVLLLGIAAVLVRFVLAVTHRIRVIEVIASPWFYVGVVVLEGVIALESSRNAGTGFLAPVVPCLIALGVTGLLARLHGPTALLAAAAVIVVAALPPWLGKLPLHTPNAAPVVFSVPGIGAVTVFDRQTAFDAAAAGEATTADPNASGWATAGEILVEDVDRLAGEARQSPRVVFGFSNRLLNENTFRLDQLLARGTGADVRLFNSPAHDGAGEYTARLQALAGSGAAFLLIRNGSQGDFQPLPHSPALVRAAESSGFAIRQVVALPDGTAVDIWQR